MESIAADSIGFAWIESGISNGRVMWGNAALTDYHAMGTGQSSPTGLAIDATYMYWANFIGGDIWRARRDGTGVGTRIVAGEGNGIQRIAVDSTGIYWGVNGKIRASALDGSNVHTVWASAGSPYAVVVESNAVYWTDPPSGHVLKLRK
jgi:hypothetical protein